jgi:hypothetical protein
MATTYTLIEAKTLGSNTASVEFTAIAATYTDLLIRLSARSSRSAQNDDLKLTFNSVITDRTGRNLIGDGTSASSGTATVNAGLIDGATATASTFGNQDIYITNYASSNFKSISVDSVTENNAIGAHASLFASLWSSTSAITSILLAPNAGDFVTYSTFYLYGISNA